MSSGQKPRTIEHFPRMKYRRRNRWWRRQRRAAARLIQIGAAADLAAVPIAEMAEAFANFSTRFFIWHEVEHDDAY